MAVDTGFILEQNIECFVGIGGNRYIQLLSGSHGIDIVTGIYTLIILGQCTDYTVACFQHKTVFLTRIAAAEYDIRTDPLIGKQSNGKNRICYILPRQQSPGIGGFALGQVKIYGVAVGVYFAAAAQGAVDRQSAFKLNIAIDISAGNGYIAVRSAVKIVVSSGDRYIVVCCGIEIVVISADRYIVVLSAAEIVITATADDRISYGDAFFKVEVAAGDGTVVDIVPFLNVALPETVKVPDISTPLIELNAPSE